MPIKKPTTTPFPDEILDYWLARLSCAELRCLCYIVRHTFGYGKNITGDPISLKQFVRGITDRAGREVDGGTGLSSKTTVCEALASLERKGLIKRTHRSTLQGDADVTIYVLDLADEEVWPLRQAAGGGTEIVPRGTESVPGSSTERTTGGTEIGLQVVRKSYPQQTTKQETTKQQTTSKGNGCAASAAPSAEQTKDEQMRESDPGPGVGAHDGAPAEQTAARGRRRKMTDEEKADVEAALARFNARLRPIVDDEYGRFMRETLQGIRGFGVAHFLATIDLLATNPRFVDDPYVTPLLVTKTVPIWEDNGKPRSWRALEDAKKRRMQNGRH